MWPVLIALAVFASFMVPSLRVLWSALLSLAFVPAFVLVRYRSRLDAPARIVPAVDPSIPAPIRANLTRQGDAIMALLGWVDHGILVTERVDGVTTEYTRLLSHPESGALAVFSCSWGMQNLVQRVAQFVTRNGDAALVSSNHEQAPAWEVPGRTMHTLPTLKGVGLLWEAHRALVERAGMRSSGGVVLPADDAGWIAWMSDARARDLAAAAAGGFARFRRRSRVYRFTLRGAIVLSWRSLWPWKAKLLREAREQERRTLTELGLERLLEEAARVSDEQLDAAEKMPSGGLRIPDDRGQLRAVATASALNADERRSDPRFRALIAQSGIARQQAYGRTAPWMLVGAAVLIVVLSGGFGMPVSASAPIGLVTMFFASVFANVSKASSAERAAAEVLLSRGVCPSCLYGLDGLGAAEDECLVCPECGGAWKRERVRDFDRFARTVGGGPESVVSVARAMEVVAGGMGGEHARWRDDRGNRCRLVPPRLGNELALARPEVRARLSRARKQIARSGWLVRRGVALIAGVLFIGPPAWMLARGGIGLGKGGLVMVLSIVIGGLMILGILRGNFAYRRRAIARAMLAQRLCPSCAEDLLGRAAGEDGCVQCDCGAAWAIGGGG